MTSDRGVADVSTADASESSSTTAQRPQARIQGPASSYQGLGFRACGMTSKSDIAAAYAVAATTSPRKLLSPEGGRIRGLRLHGSGCEGTWYDRR